MILLLPFVVMWIVTLIFFKNEYLPTWHMHRCYLFVWVLIPLTVCLKKRTLAMIISFSYIGSVLLAWLIGAVANTVSRPISVMSENSRWVFIWLIVFYTVLVLALLVTEFYAWRVKERDETQKKEALRSLICTIIPLCVVLPMGMLLPFKLISVHRIIEGTAVFVVPALLLVSLRRGFLGRRLSYAYCTALLVIGSLEAILECFLEEGPFMVYSSGFLGLNMVIITISIMLFLVVRPERKKDSESITDNEQG